MTVSNITVVGSFNLKVVNETLQHGQSHNVISVQWRIKSNIYQFPIKNKAKGKPGENRGRKAAGSKVLNAL
ncbi:hypothetical protein OBV_36300 [Oscillibacter valericigenes Sjm18-20]|nr:hypothetical protein OBV_36300 [Oscillibacter valericigenes Sjm18-20]